MAYNDLREWIAALERAGELKRVKTEVDPVLEIAEITDRVSKGNFAGESARAILQPKSPAHPLGSGPRRRKPWQRPASRLMRWGLTSEVNVGSGAPGNNRETRRTRCTAEVCILAS